MTDPERALVGVEEIAAYIERLWRERRHRRGVRVTARTVRRWLHRQSDPLPAERLAEGPWNALPSQVASWWERNVISTGMSSNAQNA